MDAKSMTGPGSHRATERGYAAGLLVEPGDAVPAGIPVSAVWMEPAGDVASRGRAPGDGELPRLTKPALEAIAAERGIAVAGLGKAEIVAAILGAG